MSSLIRKAILCLATLGIIIGTSYAYHATHDFERYRLLAERHFDAGHFALAVDYAFAAFRARPEDRFSTNLIFDIAGIQNNEHLLIRLGRTMDDIGYHEAALLIRIGDHFYRQNQYATAEEYYRLAVLYQSDHLAKQRLAEVLTWQQEYDEAVQLLQRLTHLHPANLNLLQMRADIHYWQKEYSAAAEDYQALVQKQHNITDNLLKLAESLRHIERFEDAEAIYRRYLRQSRSVEANNG